MAIVRYNPLRELQTLQEQMNRLMESPWRREFDGEDLKEGLWHPPVDIYEDAESLVVKAEVPDIDQKDIEVKIENNTLSIKGERKHESDVRKENFHRVERYFGTFSRSFQLPPTVDQEKVTAVCDKGVLTITLAKKEVIKPKQISVTVK
jgi:HSP20 family protein